MPKPRFQQFIVRALDDRGDPITDYNLEVAYMSQGLVSLIKTWSDLDLDVHTYGSDKSLRCFHLNLDDLDALKAKLGVAALVLRVTVCQIFHAAIPALIASDVCPPGTAVGEPRGGIPMCPRHDGRSSVSNAP